MNFVYLVSVVEPGELCFESDSQIAETAIIAGVHPGCHRSRMAPESSDLRPNPLRLRKLHER